MNRTRKSIFLTVLTVIIVAVIFIRRYIPSGENTAFNVTVRKAGSSVSVSAGANDVYIQAGDIPCPEIRSRDETVYLTDDMAYTYAFTSPTPMIITLPEDSGVLEINGSGDIYLSGVTAEAITAVTAGGMLDADSLDAGTVSLRSVRSNISVSASKVKTLTLETSGGNADVTGTEAEKLHVKTLSGDILAEVNSKETVLESTDGTITIYSDTSPELKADGEWLVSDSAHGRLSVKTGGSFTLKKGE